MAVPFSRMLVLLRKERGLSQKQAAIDLGVSQALLSHYEKGIRQGGLDFVVRVADYYNVSCDYLLGRTADKTGAIINAEDIPSGDEEKPDTRSRGSVTITLNKKLLFNSIHILYDMLQKCNNKALTAEVSEYLTLAVYAMFRELYVANPKNPEALFEIPDYRYRAAITGRMTMQHAEITQLAGGHAVGTKEGVKPSALPHIVPDELAREYPMFATSLMNLLHNAEKDLE